MMSTLEKVTAESESGATQLVPTWEPAPSGVVSLFDMLKFWADFFVKAVWDLNVMEAKWGPNDSAIPAPQQVGAAACILQLQCMEHGLIETAKKCGRIMEQFDGSKRATYRQAVTALGELRERLEDELQSRVFLSLSVKDGELYEKPDDKWHPVISRFYKLRHDIEESSKCFALGRYAAALFHVLLVAEFGVIKVAELFGAAGDKPGWGALDRLQRINDKKWNDKTPLEQQHADFLKSVLPLAFAIKDSWRHKISHVDNKLDWTDTDFSPEVAGEIISATRGFMRRLAQGLPK
jgi:hypothetical protein